MKMRLQQAFFNSSQGPQHREFRKEILQAMRVGVWAPTQRISKRNSTGNASWGVGPNIEKLDSQFLQTMQVGGAPTQKLAESQLTIMCKLGWDNDKVILFL
ncbi:hypothetical protein BG726_02075 [Staphylococcus aureus]|nr:hypothetical protein SABB_05345 [Staphylococcus aureus]AND35425.1 hypothetical protein ASL17_04505 [Staphylococcus aureus]AND44070.1 hypothetical protein ASL18_04495 [Staphylococcus aureus]MDH2937068.1 hypothetical protein [Staphylococcus aureus]MDH2950562.1 hypothetical protein [Staphylococcus aureus]